MANDTDWEKKLQKRYTECDKKSNWDTDGKINTDIEHMTDRESLTEEETNWERLTEKNGDRWTERYWRG